MRNAASDAINIGSQAACKARFYPAVARRNRQQAESLRLVGVLQCCFGVPCFEPFLEHMPRSLWHVSKTYAYSSGCILPRGLSRKPNLRSVTGNTELKIHFGIDGDLALGLDGNAILTQIHQCRRRNKPFAARKLLLARSAEMGL